MSATSKSDTGILILRLGIGLTATYYGSQQLLGLFGGAGFHNTVITMKSDYGIPPVFAILAMVSEFFGGLGILLGFFTSIAAFGLACTMAVATFETWKDPNFANRVFTQGNSELASQAFHASTLFCGSAALMFFGGGAISIDAHVFKPRKKRKSK